MRYFKLLKDTYNIKAGEIVKTYTNNKLFYSIDNVIILSKYVENNPEWFKEVWKCKKCGEFKSYEIDKLCNKCFEKKTVKIEPLELLLINKKLENKINEIIDWINNG